MTTAEELFNEETLDAKAKRLCIDYDCETMGDVKYTLYSFEDGSKLRLGDNGYIGCEIPA